MYVVDLGLVKKLYPMTTKRKYGTKEMAKDYGPVTFAKLLHTYRVTEGLTQSELGEKIGNFKPWNYL